MSICAERQDLQSVLELHHTDYSLYVYSGAYEGMYRKAISLLHSEESVTTIYKWGKDATLFVGNIKLDNNNDKARASFFENTDYQIDIDFAKSVVNACVISPQTNDIQDKFHFSKHRHSLSGNLNFGNDIGLFDFNVQYTTADGSKHVLQLSSDVLSSKLDYHMDLKKILKDIEAEYRLLSFSFLRKTYHGLAIDANGENSDLAWWNIFQSIQEDFLNAARLIIDRPHNRLKSDVQFLRADKLKRLSPQLENELAENRTRQNHMYRSEMWALNDDTEENRFLKMAVNQAAERFKRLRNRIESYKELSDEAKAAIKSQDDELTRLRCSGFFRRIGSFRGLKGENLVLKQATGYSTIFRCHILLQSAYDLMDGMYRMELKDIATLYEIWCFIEVKNIVKDILNEQNNSEIIETNNGKKLNPDFVLSLAQGEHSKVVLKHNDVELAEVLYNYQLDANKSGTDSKDIKTFTVSQRPDIVLRLTKDDVETGLKLTYLFDAKYRIDGEDKGVGMPHEDCINQMHRYRDAIYYGSEEQKNGLRKEVLGGYILFPGNGTSEKVQLQNFYKSIERVNIGAFPLRPVNNESSALLRSFIRKLITEQTTATILQEVIPQKGTHVEVHDRVLVGLVKDKAAFDGSLYYTRSKFPTTISLNNLHYFMPYEKGVGVQEIYEIKRIRTITSKEAKNDSSANDDLRLAFELGDHKPFFPAPKMISLSIDYSFSDTTIGELQN